ncbi:ATP-binding protein [Butyrivibrio sp. NC3005]|uniref:ATP-binding protein n=1 Tax=Butyrivibrio sp. NC3005 TaxID=1280685 RepID=UPI000403A08D|nr:ATP-binding protein [Butyrivibrio sp. NC3005]
MSKEISTSIYSFKDLIENNCIYIDKTKYLYDIVTAAKGQFFCARPRRFGKSLTISTIEAIFRGQKELFKDCYIYKETNYNWEEYPIIHLDFGRANLTRIDLLSSWLVQTLNNIAESYGVRVQNEDPALLFGELIEGLYRKNSVGVVVLIDEYDKPIMEHLENEDEAEVFRTFMETFYQMIKGYEQYERFVFMTGVIKFAKLSIFSKLNSLTDISMDKKYACMFGYTADEIEMYFGEYIDELVKKRIYDENRILLDRKGILEALKRWYDGFRFFPREESVYNPVSIGSFFRSEGIFSNYWFETGTPKVLTKTMQLIHITLDDVRNPIISRDTFSVFDITEFAFSVEGIRDNISRKQIGKQKFMQLLYQTGYMTIGDVPEDGLSDSYYPMHFPNKEVRDSFQKSIVSLFVDEDLADFSATVDFIKRAAREGNSNDIRKYMENVFANIPYSIQIAEEKYYQSIMYTVFFLCGMDIDVEEATNIGRIDAVMEAGKHLYIFEFKFEKTVEEALEQIEKKEYVNKYLVNAEEKGQIIHKIGVEFSYNRDKRNIVEWKEA